MKVDEMYLRRVCPLSRLKLLPYVCAWEFSFIELEQTEPQSSLEENKHDADLGAADPRLENFSSSTSIKSSSSTRPIPFLTAREA